MSCKNPTECSSKAIRWAQKQEIQTPIGDSLLEEICQGEVEFRLTKHTNIRMKQKCFSKKDILTIAQNGWTIEYHKTVNVEQLIVLGYLKPDAKTYRPVHLVFKRIGGGSWDIITIYSPDSKKHLWSEDYQKRICFCE